MIPYSLSITRVLIYDNVIFQRYGIILTEQMVTVR